MWRLTLICIDGATKSGGTTAPMRATKRALPASCVAGTFVLTTAVYSRSQQAVQASSQPNNGNDITRPIHRVDFFLNKTELAGDVTSWTSMLRYERPVVLQNDWNLAFRADRFGATIRQWQVARIADNWVSIQSAGNLEWLILSVHSSLCLRLRRRQ